MTFSNSNSKIPLVSFVVPTYNYGHYLPECVTSILEQTYPRLEVLILDDCSSDNTSDVVTELSNNDTRVVYHRNNPNKGHIANYNHGIQLAKGELIWLISADDAIANPTILQTYVDAFINNPEVGFGFCRAQVINENSELVEKFIPRKPYHLLDETACVYKKAAFFKKIIQENFVPVAGVIARKEAYLKTHYYNAKLTHTGDWHLWQQFSLDWDAFYEPTPSVHYRVHQVNMHRTYENKQHPIENSLLCYDELMRYAQIHSAAASTKQLIQLGKLNFKKKHKLPLSFNENMLNTFVRPFISLKK